uniref:hypothetical protein n=1 Tax=Acetatifactor sp. TaxID=1872090 RepID=UPI00405639A4
MNQVEVKRRQIETCSWIIGLINILIFGNILGSSGITYLLIALECLFLFWTISAGSLSDTLGRMLRTRISKGQYKNTMNIRRRVLVLEGIIGAFCSIILALCAGGLTEKLFNISYSTFILLLLAPALFLWTISAVLTGFFKGEGTELPVVIVTPLRQLMWLGFGVLFANILGNYGEKVSNLLGDKNYTAMYACVGIAIAINLSELLVLVFLVVITLGSRQALRKREKEGMKQTDSLVGTIKVLFASMWFPVVIRLLQVLPIWIGTAFYRKSVADVNGFSENFGLFAGKFGAVCAIPILLICAMTYSVNAKTISVFRKEDYSSAKVLFQCGIQAIVIYGAFFVVFVAVMAEQLAGVLCKTNGKLVAEMFRYGSSLILLITLFVFLSRLLLRTGRKYHLLGCLGIINIIFIIVVSLLLNGGKAGVLSLIYASIAAFGIGTLLMGGLCFGILRRGIEWIRVIAIPVGAICVTGLIEVLIGKLLTPHLGNSVTVFVCFVISFLVYWVILILCRCFREQELKYIPGGKVIRAAGQTLRVFYMNFE